MERVFVDSICLECDSVQTVSEIIMFGGVILQDYLDAYLLIIFIKKIRHFH